jgi:gamma-butyrobetaine dioxygenase
MTDTNAKVADVGADADRRSPREVVAQLGTLAAWFPESVTEPVRLHVAAKRYLCAVEPGYFDRLSEASVYTLGVQGGPMNEEEAAAFAAGPYAQDAVTLRRWDEAAKDPDADVPGFDHYRPMLETLVVPR